MNRKSIASLLAVLAIAVGATSGCLRPSKEPPINRVSRLRVQYRISANWFEMRTAKDGTRELAMNLVARNTGKECLKHVTMLLRIVAGDGTDRISQPLTLDVSHIPPLGSGILEPVVRGVEVYAAEQVVLQMEELPSKRARETYPEFKEALSSAASTN